MLVTSELHIFKKKIFIYGCRLQFYKNDIFFQYQSEKKATTTKLLSCIWLLHQSKICTGTYNIYKLTVLN